MTNRNITIEVSDCKCRTDRCDCPTEPFTVPDAWIVLWATRLAGGRTAPIVAEITKCLSWIEDKEITQKRSGIRTRIGGWLRRRDNYAEADGRGYKTLEVEE